MDSSDSSDSDADSVEVVDCEHSETLEEIVRRIDRQLRRWRKVPDKIKGVHEGQKSLCRLLERSQPNIKINQAVDLAGGLGIGSDGDPVIPIGQPQPGSRRGSDSNWMETPSRRTSTNSHFLPGAAALSQPQRVWSTTSSIEVGGCIGFGDPASTMASPEATSASLCSAPPSSRRVSIESSNFAAPPRRRFSIMGNLSTRTPSDTPPSRRPAAIEMRSSDSRDTQVRLALVTEDRELAADSVFSVPDRLSEVELRGFNSPGARTMDRLGTFASWANVSQDSRRLRLRKLMLKPYSHGRLMWDVVLIVAIVLSTVLMPLASVYLSREILLHLDSAVGAVACLADTVWFLNIFICLITGYFAEGFLVLDTVSIIKRYVTTWLPIDLLSAYPMILARWPDEAVDALVVVKLTRLLRVLPLFSRLQREYRSTTLMPVKVATTVMMLLHLMCCGWRWAQGVRPEIEGHPWGDYYVEDAYWVLMTMTTVGYGDVVPNSTGSRIYAIGIMLASPMFFGTIISGLTHVTKEVFTDPIEAKVSKATRFMTKRGVSQTLQRKVEHNLRQHIVLDNLSSMDPDLVSLLSPTLQKELALELVSSTVLKFPLLKSAPYSFISQLATTFEWIMNFSGDIVAEEGQLVLEVSFVMRGRLHVDSAEPSALDRHRLFDEEGPLEFPVGAWFGETCLFIDDATHKFTATALVDSELATLQASAYHAVASKYPRVAEQQRNLQSAIQKKRASVSELAFKTRGPLTGRTENSVGLTRSGAKIARKFGRGLSSVHPF
mmetsp:Transcript_101519/g.293799  ORF Transcript_101519/g.293799 Transcript_101519/m.293799 type:complete len:776 (+) Transcript_101519:75-2402(+)